MLSNFPCNFRLLFVQLVNWKLSTCPYYRSYLDLLTNRGENLRPPTSSLRNSLDFACSRFSSLTWPLDTRVTDITRLQDYSRVFTGWGVPCLLGVVSKVHAICMCNAHATRWYLRVVDSAIYIFLLHAWAEYYIVSSPFSICSYAFYISRLDSALLSWHNWLRQNKKPKEKKK